MTSETTRESMASETAWRRLKTAARSEATSEQQAAQSTHANFFIARELHPEATNPIFEIIFVTHPKTRQNPLREILLVHRQKYTWTFPDFFRDFFRIFPEKFYEKMGWNTESRVRRRKPGIQE